MLEKFSVRKPMTVVVGLILVIVLGLVSITDMTMDLMPEMELPFVAVFTTYFGATPDQVERDLTIPLETSMSTLSGIDTVQSISSEHVSILILQFTEATNMDSASLEIRESLDMLNLPDGASRPSMIRMNPEMLPIMTANVHMDGYTIHQLSEFAIREVGPALEAVPGVAVVSISGLVNNQMHVILRQEYIDAVNLHMTQTIEGFMGAAREAALEEMQQQVEATIAERIEAFSEARMTELISEGLSVEDAELQLNNELLNAIQIITEEVMLDMAAAIDEMDAGAFDTAGHHGADEHDEASQEANNDDGQALATGTDPQAEAPEIALPAEMLSVSAITGILNAQNFSMPAGMIAEDGATYMVRIGDTFSHIDEVKNMLVFDPGAMGIPGMEPIRLLDVAEVFLTDDSHLSFTRVNGNPSVMFSIQRQSEFATADVAAAVRSRMDGLSDEHPGLGFAVMMDQGEMIGEVVGSVINNLIFGGILAIIILLLFLRDYRPTLIVAVSIPASLLLAFTLMYFGGVSLNMMSMSGLALTVGMLVDNSIVVIENIYRMRSSTDRSVARAAVSGTRQVSGAIAAATLTTVAMFLPIVFTGGLTRQLFQDFALTLTFSLLASLIIALTVVPAASSVMLKRVKRDQEGQIFTRFVDGYEKLLRGSIRFKWIVLPVAIALFVVSIWAIGRQGMEMFPAMDMGQITVNAELPDGTLFEEVTQVAYQLSEQTLAIEGVETVAVSVGGGGMMAMMAQTLGFGGMGGGGSAITMYVLTEEGTNISTDSLTSEIQTITDSLGLEADIGGDENMMAMMVGDAISIRVEGRELDDIRDTAIALADLVSAVPGTANVTNMYEAAVPELRVRVDKDAAMANGLTVAQVFMAAMEALSAPEESISMTLNGISYEIVVSDGDFVPAIGADIVNLQIATMTGYVTLSDIAEVYEDTGFTSINRLNRNRFITISGEIEEGFNITLVNDEIDARLQEFTPVGDTRVVVGGEVEMIANAFNDLLLMLALGLLFTYLIMVAQFQSLLAPFIIMFTIPLAFTGGFASLLVVGMPLSVVAMIGLILLSGVAINNGIMLVSRINQMRWEGMPKIDAIVDAGRKRIRPIIMTAISTIFAMSVMALGIGDGTEMMQPMAIATIGGLLYATAMTLFVVPILYDMFHRNKDVTKEDLDSPDESDL